MKPMVRIYVAQTLLAALGWFAGVSAARFVDLPLWLCAMVGSSVALLLGVEQALATVARFDEFELEHQARRGKR